MTPEHEYQLVITRRVENKNYAEEKAEAERVQRYNGYPHDRSMEPAKFSLVQVLDVEVSAETFNAIRKAALETL